MKNYIQKFICKGFILMAGASMVLTGCKESFLEPDPQTMFKPSEVFTTEDGIRSVLAICDRQLKRNYVSEDSREMMALATEYTFSDLMMPAATDKSGFLDNVDNMLRYNSDQTTEKNLGRTNSIYFFWRQGYEGVRNANTILSFIDGVPMDETLKKEYIGRAYFHRAYRYYALVFQYGHVPLLTKLTSSPKLSYHSTHRDAILEKMTLDMEFAVQWVPEQKDMQHVGMVNKGACRMLLSKLYLALGRYEDAKKQLDILIDQSGYSLMTNNFGTFFEGGEPASWPITRNVIWDLHRPENKLISANKEVIMGMPNRGAAAESFIPMLSMRIMYPFFFDGRIKMPDGKQALYNLDRTNSKYRVEYDYMRGLGRGIATFRTSTFYQDGLWAVNGKMDETDLRHSAETGNWMHMENLRCNNVDSEFYGQNIMLHSDRDFWGVKDGEPVLITAKGQLLCSDTIRRWFDVPHYIFCLDDVVNQNLIKNNGLEGATEGSVADWYLYRLAEAYLLRAEAKFYINPSDPTIKDDLNIIRKRAQCSELYTGNVTIGDIMDERLRELFYEEWRNVELTRVSLCLARSGRPDEWGNTYNVETFDKQTGTDLEGGSYWYQRCVRKGMYNKGVTIHVDATKTDINFIMGKHNIYWPIPYNAIEANKNAKLWQNVGYTEYDPATPIWNTWEEAVADEDKI